MSAHEEKRKCRVCGCDEMHACETAGGPCYWIAQDLCSKCVPLPTSDEELAVAFAALEDETVMMRLPGIEAFQLLSALQLVLRHPEIGEHFRKTLTVLARALQERLSLTPTLAAMAEAGWRTQHDVPVEPEPERRIIIP